MLKRLKLTKLQFVAALAYSAAFPLSTVVGGGVMNFFLLATIPFLPLGWILGNVAIQIFGSTLAYPVGLSAAIFLQVWGILVLRNMAKEPFSL